LWRSTGWQDVPPTNPQYVRYVPDDVIQWFQNLPAEVA